MQPSYPERICWGCEKYCSADDLACGNGTIRTPHPIELFGDNWLDWSERSFRQTSCSSATSGGPDGESADQEQAEGNAKDHDIEKGDHEAVASCAWEAASV